MSEKDLLHEVESSGYRVRIEFLNQTICNYQSLPTDLLGTFNVEKCTGNCNLLRKNFLAVWTTNTSLNTKFEKEMQRYGEMIKRKDDRIMEMESMNVHLERSLCQSNAQLAERRREIEGCPTDLGDLEEFFSRKIDESHAVLEVMRGRVADLEHALRLKEQESSAKQLQINHMLTLPNQLEHASEVNRMRHKLHEAEKKVQELTHRLDGGFVPTVVPVQRVIGHVDLRQDRVLAGRFDDFFGRGGVSNLDEEYLYSQFLLDQPNLECNKLGPDTYTRDELVEAMGRVVNCKKHAIDGRRDFAACLAAFGGRFRVRRGVRYWVNLTIQRRPMFTWDV